MVIEDRPPFRSQKRLLTPCSSAP